MKLELVSLTGPKFQEDAYQVTLPTSTGVISVFPKHMPLITTAIRGVISVRRKKGDPDDLLEHYATNGGVIEITGDRVRVLVDEADHADDIQESEAREALELAKQLKEQAKDQVELDKAQDMIDRQAVRLRVAELRRHRRHPRA